MNIRLRFRDLIHATLATLAVSSLLSGAVGVLHAQTYSVGTTYNSLPLATVTITTAGMAGSVAVVTQGSSGLDYALASPNSGTCTAGTTYAVGDTCTVQYTFAPTAPFTRLGSAVVYDAAGNVLGNTFLTQVGTGPQASFPLTAASAATALGSAFSGAKGIAVDAAGNLFIADTANSAVKEIRASDGTILTIGFGFSLPTAVAIDGAGNLYVADAGNHLVKEVVAFAGTYPAAPVVLAATHTFGDPEGVAVDASGNVYVADKGNHEVDKLVAVTGVIPASPSIVVVYTVSSSQPTSVAVDPAGNVYFTDAGSSSVVEIPIATGTPSTLTGILNAPQGIAVDGLGNALLR